MHCACDNHLQQNCSITYNHCNWQAISSAKPPSSGSSTGSKFAHMCIVAKGSRKDPDKFHLPVGALVSECYSNPEIFGSLRVINAASCTWW